MLKFILISILLHFVVAANKTKYPHCFSFTWLGPYINKDKINELTCEGLLHDSTNIPCRRPIVATDNDLQPDTDHIWYKDENPLGFTCEQTPGHSCVKYVYTFKGAAQNITYMCARVNATNGCYHQRYISGVEKTVCVCNSSKGAIPCNHATSMFYQNVNRLLMAILTTCIIFKLNYVWVV